MKGKMTIREIGRALMEIKIKDEHADDFLEALAENYSYKELFEFLLKDEPVENI